MRRSRQRTLIVAAALIAAPLAARADRLAVDISHYHISIRPSFTGAELLLFGAVNGPGNLVVVLRGPNHPIVVRRKARMAGIWLNRDQLVFADAPGYYAVAASAPLAEIGTAEMREVNQIGVANLRLTPVVSARRPDLAAFRQALFRNKVRQGLYLSEPAKLTFSGRNLFRVKFDFPANVPPGLYHADVYLVDGELLVGRTSADLVIRKSGLEASIYRYARERPVEYGLLAVAAALMAGWLTGVIFRKT